MDRLGRYVLGRELGRGGSGKVFEATLMGPGGVKKPVAVKVLKRGGEALRREARIGGLLRHHNLVDVYEVGEVDGTWFCAMERCEDSLSHYRPLPPRAVVEVGLAVCDALQYAHDELGLVHLDLKPDNLLFGADGTVKVADLGIARAEGFESDGRVRGTPGYMPPEQVRGDAVDAKADVYALARTLLKLAEGRATETSTTGGWLSEPTAVTSSTVSLDDVPADPEPSVLPSWLDPIVEPCLAISPAERPSVATFAATLRALDVEGAGLREHLGLSGTFDATPLAPLDEATDTFVGRQAELADLEEALRTPGIHTLKGPAGVGKSRLAIEAARRFKAAGHGRAWLCRLEEDRTSTDLTRAVAGQLGIVLGQRDPVGQIAEVLAGRGPVVLVLDAFEHLVDHSGILEQWTDRADQARLLVTSRVASGAANETVTEVDVLTSDEARELLRTRALDRGVEVTDDRDLQELAHRLDGLPLALELAAGRLGVLSVKDVLDRFDLGLLRSGRTDRHGTLTAALDWSWELLDGTQRRGLSQLSVFRGGFTIEAAEAVLDLPEDRWALDVVEAGVRGSWLTVRGDRFGMLESVRSYAARHLANARSVEVRHGRWYADIERRVGRRGGRSWMLGLRVELANLQAACARAMERGDGATALPALEAAWEVLVMTGPLHDAAPLAEAVAPLVADAHRARELMLRGRIYERLGRVEQAMEVFDRALVLARSTGDARTEAAILGRQSMAHVKHSRLADAARTAELALQAARKAGDRRGEGVAHGFLGVSHQERGNLEGALRNHRAALAVSREVGDRRTEGVALSSVGSALREQGHLDEAVVYYKAALAVHRELGNRRSEGLVLGNLAGLRREQGHLEEALGRSLEALQLHREVGSPLSIAIELGAIANLHLQMDRIDEAAKGFEDALALAREVGHRAFEAHVLGRQGVLALQTGDPAGARARFHEALTLSGEVGAGRQIGTWTLRLAEVERAEGNLEEALDQLQAAARVLGEVGDRPRTCVAMSIRTEVLVDLGRTEEARASLAEAESVALEGHVDVVNALARARAALGR